MSTQEILEYVSKGLLTAEQANDLINEMAKREAERKVSLKREKLSKAAVKLERESREKRVAQWVGDEPDVYVVKARKTAAAPKPECKSGLQIAPPKESSDERFDAQWASWADMPEGSDKVAFGKVLVKRLISDQRRDKRTEEDDNFVTNSFRDRAMGGLVGEMHHAIVRQHNESVEDMAMGFLDECDESAKRLRRSNRRSRQFGWKVDARRAARFFVALAAHPMGDRFGEGIETAVNGKDFINAKFGPLHPIADEQFLKGLLQWENGAVDVVFYGCAIE